MARWATLETVSNALSGERSAVDQLIIAIWPGCFRLAASIIGDRALAQDAAQEACAIVYRKMRTLRNVAAFDIWLYRIVLREAARLRRKHAVIDSTTYEGCFAVDETTTLDVVRAVAALPTAQRDVVVLRYFHDVKGDEIASILHIPHTTVRTRLARARERLRGLLDDYDDKPNTRHQEISRSGI